MDGIGVFYEPEAYSTNTDQLMGRHAAGEGFMRAYAATRPHRAWCFSRTEAARADMARLLGVHGSPATRIDWVGLHNLTALETPGILYRPDPAIADDAWRRLGHAGPAAWSLCGITHTTAHHSVTETLAGMLIAPLESWDALICTSESVQASVLGILEAQAEYLGERLGAQPATLPQLPVIPLGIHTADFGVLDRERAAARRALGLEPRDTVFLFVGRLSAYSKAHPVPMFVALEACATDRDDTGSSGRITLVQAGWFETEAARVEFEADARSLCPSVRLITVDGRDPKTRRQAWAAADVFTSLADSIQETFGLTPLEAMASGLPVVVSDWNGYKDSVRDGIDGFRIPTTAMPSGTGQSLADRYALGLDDYHGHIGIVGQFVAVDVEAAAVAYRRLARDPALRRRMGAAGQMRARSDFEWSTIFCRYEDLWSELGEIRRAAAAVPPTRHPRHRPRPARSLHHVRRLPDDVPDARDDRSQGSRGHAGPGAPAPRARHRSFRRRLPARPGLDRSRSLLLAGREFHGVRRDAPRTRTQSSGPGTRRSLARQDGFADAEQRYPARAMMPGNAARHAG